MGRAGLSVRGYASGNRRCSADCVPVSAGGRYCHCVISPGSGAYDCEKSLQHGQDDECAGDWSGGKLQLCKMS